MAATPEWKVHNAAGEYRAACKDVEDAGVLAEMYGRGACIKNRGWGSKALYVVDDMIGPDEIAQRVFVECERRRGEYARDEEVAEAIATERARVLKIAAGLMSTAAYCVLLDQVEKGAKSAWGN